MSGTRVCVPVVETAFRELSGMFRLNTNEWLPTLIDHPVLNLSRCQGAWLPGLRHPQITGEEVRREGRRVDFQPPVDVLAFP